MELEREYLVLKFEGSGQLSPSRASSDNKEDKDSPEYAKEKEINLINTLNSNSIRIARRISNEIKKRLPLDSTVETEIRFKKGSLSWDGVLYVLANFPELGKTSELAKFLEKGVEIIINRILGSRLPDEYKNSLRTEVSAEMEPDMVSTSRYSSASLFNYIFLTVLLILTVINTAMLFGFIFSKFIKF